MIACLQPPSLHETDPASALDPSITPSISQSLHQLFSHPDTLGNMRSKSVRPSHYPPVPFHTIRFIDLLSAVVVAIVVAVFIYSLQQKGYKLPWAFLIVCDPLSFDLYCILTLLAHHLRTPLNNKHHSHHSNPLLLRPLPTPLAHLQWPPPYPLERFSRSTIMGHETHTPDVLHEAVLGHDDGDQCVQGLQSLIHLHSYRHRISNHGCMARCHCAQTPDEIRRVQSHGE